MPLILFGYSPFLCLEHLKQEVLLVFPGCLEYVLRMYQECSKGVLRLLKGCFLGV